LCHPLYMIENKPSNEQQQTTNFKTPNYVKQTLNT
jgi:hypothetical protein